MEITGQQGCFTKAAIVLDYPLLEKGWAAWGPQIPWAIALEAAPALGRLLSFLGVDLQDGGLHDVRITDGAITVFDQPPGTPEDLRCQLYLDGESQLGARRLFWFHGEWLVGGARWIRLDDGCAGIVRVGQFGQGQELGPRTGKMPCAEALVKKAWDPPLICQKTEFAKEELQLLATGDEAGCFGDHFRRDGLPAATPIAWGQPLLLDRISLVEPLGGARGLGRIVAEKELNPTDECFKRSENEPGAMPAALLMAGGLQLAQFFQLYLGAQTLLREPVFRPMPGVRQILTLRGEVVPARAKLVYTFEVLELGWDETPFLKGLVEIRLAERLIARVMNVGLQLQERDPALALAPRAHPPARHHVATAPLVTDEQVREFCVGQISKCLGPQYAFYDSGTIKTSRLPNTHLNLVSRALSLEGQPGVFKGGETVVTEYDVPCDTWYFRHNAVPDLPYFILMEIALQPTGIISGAMGTTLLFPDENLFFRNLDGSGRIMNALDVRGKTLTNVVRLLSTTKVHGVILQAFDFHLACEGTPLYEGETTFGHFIPAALANQVGLDAGRKSLPWYADHPPAAGTAVDLDLREPELRARFYCAPPGKPGYRLGHHQLDLLDRVKIIPAGGRHGQGYVYAEKTVQPGDWYFRCHFFQDPVMPGSLGVESILQALRVFALSQDLGRPFQSPCLTYPQDHLVRWKYRGQIPHARATMAVEVHVARLVQTPGQCVVIGDGSLWRDGLRIYEVKDAAICLREQAPAPAAGAVAAP